MLRQIFTATLLLLLFQTATAQNRDCATMEVLDRQLEENPELQQQFDSLNALANQATLEKSVAASGKEHTYPIIPGFEPTGDPSTDARNFGIAKKELYASDPELYLRLTSKVMPADHSKTPRK
jgi:hypothetical protein